MKRLLAILLAAILIAPAALAQTAEPAEAEGLVVLLQTTLGEVRIRLFNDTPLHRDRFLSNVRQGLYDGVLFHRVIRNFMIQGGNPNTRPGFEAQWAAEEADTTLGDTISAEIRYPKYFHRQGMVAAARMGDDVNPTKASSATEFYIVTGRFQSEQQMLDYDQRRQEQRVAQIFEQKRQANAQRLEQMQRDRDRLGLNRLLEKLMEEAQEEADASAQPYYGQEQLRAYRSVGGAPWLDGDYTIFGEVIDGMKVVRAIEKVKTNDQDRPLDDIRIVRATVVE